LNDEELGVKRDGTASDKRNGGDNPSAPPPLFKGATPVDEPVAGKPQSAPSGGSGTFVQKVTVEKPPKLNWLRYVSFFNNLINWKSQLFSFAEAF
jgi:hypothetical protein